MSNYKADIAATTKTVPFTSVNQTSTPMSDSTPIITPAYTTANTSITTPVHTLMVNTPTAVLITPPTHTSVSTSLTTHGLEILLKITVRINLLFIIAF